MQSSPSSARRENHAKFILQLLFQACKLWRIRVHRVLLNRDIYYWKNTPVRQFFLGGVKVIKNKIVITCYNILVRL